MQAWRMTTEPSGTRSSRWKAAAQQRVEQGRASIEESRRKHPSVDLAFDLTGRDAATGGAVLAGAIAFRLFLWTLPATLVIVGVLGFAEDTAASDAGKLGLGTAATQSVAQAAAQAHRARWTLVALGAVFLVSVSRTLGATLRT